MFAQVAWGAATGIGLAIFAAVCTLIGGVWKMASVLFRIEAKVDRVEDHVKDHCDDINEVKADVKDVSFVKVRQLREGAAVKSFTGLSERLTFSEK